MLSGVLCRISSKTPVCNYILIILILSSFLFFLMCSCFVNLPVKASGYLVQSLVEVNLQHLPNSCVHNVQNASDATTTHDAPRQPEHE